MCSLDWWLETKGGRSLENMALMKASSGRLYRRRLGIQQMEETAAISACTRWEPFRAHLAVSPPLFH